MSARLLIIGLDGADGRTLDRGSRDGTLPNLTALRARGCTSALTSMLGATDDALWASFQYGTDIGQHGRYSYMVPTRAGELGYAVMQEVDRAAFWDGLSERGLRVAVVDVPKCRLPRSLNGIHLVDWLTHGRYFHPPRSYPDTLVDDIVARFGAAPPSRCDYAQPSPLVDEDVRTVRDNLLRSVGQKRAAGLHVLASEPWDLFIIGFKEAHCASHLLWEFVDPHHPDHDADRVERVGNPVLDILRQLDASVGELVAAAGPDAEVVIFSTTDYVPNGSAMHMMPNIADRLNDYVGRSFGERVRSALRRLRGQDGSPPACRSVVYTDNAGALLVPRRSDENALRYARRLDLIAALAFELVDVDDGLPVASAITRPAFEQDGERAANLPHLLLHFRAGICPRAVASARLGRIEAPLPGHMRTGNHESGGFVLAVGQAATGALAEVKTMSDFGRFAERVLDERVIGTG